MLRIRNKLLYILCMLSLYFLSDNDIIYITLSLYLQISLDDIE